MPSPRRSYEGFERVSKINIEDSHMRHREILIERRKAKKEKQLWRKRRNVVTPSPTKSMDEDIVITLVKIMITNTLCPEEHILGIVQQIRTMICFENNEITAKNIVDTKGIPTLVAFLERNESPILQQEVICILTKLCLSSFSSEVLLIPDFLERIVHLLQSSKPKVRQEAIRFVTEVTDDNVKVRDKLFEMNISELILENIHKGQDESLIAAACSALPSLCKGEPQPAMHYIEPIIHVAVGVLLDKSSHLSFKSQALQCLVLISDVENDLKRMWNVFEIGAFPLVQQIVQVLVDIQENSVEQQQELVHEVELWEPALQILCNFCFGPEICIIAVASSRILEIASELLDKASRNILRERMCTVISKICGERTGSISLFETNTGVLKSLFSLSKEGSSRWCVRREAIMASANIVLASSNDHVKTFVEQGGIEVLVDSLLIKIDCDVVIKALCAINRIFSTGEKENRDYVLRVNQEGGVDMIEYLSSNGNDSVSEKANGILEQFLSEVD